MKAAGAYKLSKYCQYKVEMRRTNSVVSQVYYCHNFNVFRVRALIENSPAIEAGLKVGDILTAIDGKPTAEMTLEQIRRMFRRTGQTYKLSIKREETSLEITLKTRRIV